MAKINFKPLADRVLVEPSAAETKTASGIIIPDTAQEKPQKGKPVSARPNAIQSFSASVRGYFTRRLEVALGRSSGASSIRESKKIQPFGRAIRVIDSQRAGIPRG